VGDISGSVDFENGEFAGGELVGHANLKIPALDKIAKASAISAFVVNIKLGKQGQISGSVKTARGQAHRPRRALPHPSLKLARTRTAASTATT